MPLDVAAQHRSMSLGSNFCPLPGAQASSTGRLAHRPKLARGKWCTDAFGRHCEEIHQTAAAAAAVALPVAAATVVHRPRRRRYRSHFYRSRFVDAGPSHRLPWREQTVMQQTGTEVDPSALKRRQRQELAWRTRLLTAASDWDFIFKPFLMLVYLVNDASMYIVGDLATHEYTKQTVLLSSAIFSLSAGYFSTWYRRGWGALRDCLNPIGIIRLLPVSICFFLSNLAQLSAFRYFDGTFIKLFGQTKLPLTALLSYMLLHRRYTLQQWLTMTMLTVACITFTVMKIGGVSTGRVDVLGLAFVLMWVVLNVIGTLQAERAFKVKPEIPFTTIMMRLHAGKLLASGTMLFLVPNFRIENFFAGWDRTTFCVLFTLLFDAWLSGAMVKTLSSVTKSVVKCASLVLLYIVGLSTGRQGFNTPQMLTGVTIVLQTLLFATLSPGMARREHDGDRGH
mmetsp:Transcript_38676/g.70420  ORF Transcript_38676/g.70420 Transcript_38676/m.70420 type:complete len:452 (-) Transcript_38676:117-1472(-)